MKGAIIAPKVTHQAAVTDWANFARLLGSVWTYTGTPETCAALKLMALLYPQPGELRQAEWSEFYLEKGVWTIPAERAKMRRSHKKPLPGLALGILLEHRHLADNRRLVFPASTTTERPISDNTMNLALRRMGFGKDEATSHGFRATASTLLNESGLWSADAIEAELAPMGGNAVRRAYHRASYWDERIRMADGGPGASARFWEASGVGNDGNLKACDHRFRPTLSRRKRPTSNPSVESQYPFRPTPS